MRLYRRVRKVHALNLCKEWVFWVKMILLIVGEWVGLSEGEQTGRVRVRKVVKGKNG